MLALALTPALALAHPFAKSEYSMRTNLKMTDSLLMVVVIQEVPIPVVLDEFGGPDPEAASRKGKKELEAYNQQRWDALEAGLSLAVNGVQVPVEWRPVVSEVNGKAAEGFFLYMVGVQLEVAAQGWGQRVEVVVTNGAQPGVPTWFSGAAEARGVWTVLHDDARQLLGVDTSKGDGTSTAEWTQDEALRRYRVVFGR